MITVQAFFYSGFTRPEKNFSLPVLFQVPDNRPP